VREELKGLAPRLQDLLKEILEARQALLVHPQPYTTLGADLTRLFPERFLRQIPLARLRHYGRYLRAMKIRADRWKQNPSKDAERAKTMVAFDRAGAGLSLDEPCRWLIEEFRVSLFAQEVGTAEPVSAPKVESALAAVRQRQGEGESISPAAAPSPPLKVTEKSSPKPLSTLLQKPSQPLKSLNALDKLFGR
jgi:ATP-dependent helicase HrpA